MDDAGFRRWLERYVDAWRTYDEEAIGSLFSEDAVYRSHPWDEGDDAPRGRAAIVASWTEEPDPPSSWTADYQPWVVASDRAVALGTTRYLSADGAVEQEFHNTFLCVFDDEGRCGEFTEIFLLRPPDGRPDTT